MSCPNPSAHPVGVRHTRRTSARAARSEATHHRPARTRRSSLSVGLVPTSPTQAEPDIDDVQARVDTPLPRGRAGLGALQRRQASSSPSSSADLDCPPGRRRRARTTRVDKTSRSQVQDSIVRPVRRPEPLGRRPGRASPTTRAQFLVRADHDDGLQRHPGPALRRLRHRGQGARHPSRRRPRTAPTRWPTTEKQLAKEKATVDDKLAEAKELLGELKEEERARAPRRGQPRQRRPACPTCPSPGVPRAAVNYALAQVGDAYVYGAAGPSAFDCSGLTMMAWAQAGVGLPHSSERAVRLRPARLVQRASSPGTWSSTTARSATSASTSATA